MNKKTLILLLIAGGLIVGILIMLFGPKKNTLSTPNSLNKTQAVVQISASKTLKSYTDPSGFTFSYPDNLSLVNNEPKDNSTYADIQLAVKGADENLAIKIVDSKLATLDDWVKTTKSSQPSKEAKLGNLKALEVIADDKLLLGALDQGVLFTIETPNKSNKDFWITVHDKVLADFSFAPPPTSGGTGSSGGITFEGEEVVE